MGTGQLIGIEVDVPVKERGKAASLLDPVTETIFRGDLQSIGAVEEARLDLSEDTSSEDVAALVTVKDEAHAAPKAASTTFIGRTQSSGLQLPPRFTFAVKPPTLMAAIFPWDCKSKMPTMKIYDRAMINGILRFTVEGVAAGRKLLMEEKSPTMARLRVDGHGALEKVQDGCTSMVPIWFSTREMKILKLSVIQSWSTMSERNQLAVRDRMEVEFLENGPSLFGASIGLSYEILGCNIFTGIQIPSSSRTLNYLEFYFNLTTAIYNFVWDSGEKFLFYAVV